MDAETRARERKGAAIVRALGRTPDAEYRARQLHVHDRPVGIATPYLLPNRNDTASAVGRGLYDSIGVRLRHSDAELFAQTEPDRLVARIIFDMLEQIRCESLVPAELAGTRANIETGFRKWCSGQTLTNNDVGLLVYTVLHMVRARLISPIHDELIEDQIEATRANISPIIGTALAGLREHRHDQAAFAVVARSLADAIDELVADSDDAEQGDEPSDEEQSALVVPPEWNEFDLNESAVGQGTLPGVSTPNESLDALGGYTVYTTEFDVEQKAEDFYPLARRRYLRTRLDEQIAAQSVSAFTLSRRYRLIFRGVESDGWRTGEEEGVLDSARLGQVVANPANRAVFRQRRFRPAAPAVVSFLLDNSGSMKRQRHETLAVLVDTLARALDLAGATSEILGFTTASWNGGHAQKEWKRAGQPENPGRLADLSHIVYKDADTPWKRSRLSVASLMRTQQFRESVDGEAIIWGYRRLLARPEERKYLVVVSDGAPTEAATRRTNGEAYLETHLRNVVDFIEREGQVSLGAISVDQSVDAVFRHSVDMDLSGTLSLDEYRLLEQLFIPSRRGGGFS